MTYRTILAMLLAALSVTTCAAQDNNPAFAARQAARGREEARLANLCSRLHLWIRSELDPADGVAILKDRIVGFEIHDLHAFNASGRGVPLGSGVGNLPKMLDTLAKVKKGPVLLSIECHADPDNPCDGVKKSLDFLDAQAMRLSKLAP
jgi:sugar phosphate isomerase/epimerase